MNSTFFKKTFSASIIYEDGNENYNKKFYRDTSPCSTSLNSQRLCFSETDKPNLTMTFTVLFESNPQTGKKISQLLDLSCQKLLISLGLTLSFKYSLHSVIQKDKSKQINTTTTRFHMYNKSIQKTHVN